MQKLSEYMMYKKANCIWTSNVHDICFPTVVQCQVSYFFTGLLWSTIEECYQNKFQFSLEINWYKFSVPIPISDYVERCADTHTIVWWFFFLPFQINNSLHNLEGDVNYFYSLNINMFSMSQSNITWINRILYIKLRFLKFLDALNAH